MNFGENTEGMRMLLRIMNGKIRAAYREGLWYGAMIGSCVTLAVVCVLILSLWWRGL